MASVSDPKLLEADAVNPMGTDGFEFVEYTAPDPERARPRCSRAWASPRSRATAPRT